jgi:predicted nucleic acid-binding protein
VAGRGRAPGEIHKVIVLDTNVLSAIMRPQSEAVVEAWFNSLRPETVWTTAITLFEIRFGLELLPPGRRRRRLEQASSVLFEEDLDGRVLPFDDVAAYHAAAIAARERGAGRSIEIRDLQIAGIASAQKATLATRNARHFEGLGVAIVNPWAAT